jgi:plastocyanin
MNRKLFVLVLGLLALSLAACGGESAAPEPQQITVVMNDIYYGETNDNQNNPPIWSVSAGAEVTLSLENRGALEHNWAILNLGAVVPTPFEAEGNADLLLYDPGVVSPGETSTVTFTAPEEPGEYVVVCTVAGHYPLMQGRLFVEAS